MKTVNKLIKDNRKSFTKLNMPYLLMKAVCLWFALTFLGCSTTTAYVSSNIFADKAVVFKIKPEHDFLDVASVISDELMRNGYKVYVKKEFTSISNNSSKPKKSFGNGSIIPNMGNRIIIVNYYYDPPVWDVFNYKLNRFEMQWIDQETGEILAGGSFRGNSFLSYAGTVQQVVQEVMMKAGVKPVGYFSFE